MDIWLIKLCKTHVIRKLWILPTQSTIMNACSIAQAVCIMVKNQPPQAIIIIINKKISCVKKDSLMALWLFPFFFNRWAIVTWLIRWLTRWMTDVKGVGTDDEYPHGWRGWPSEQLDATALGKGKSMAMGGGEGQSWTEFWQPSRHKEHQHFWLNTGKDFSLVWLPSVWPQFCSFCFVLIASIAMDFSKYQWTGSPNHFKPLTFRKWLSKILVTFMCQKICQNKC